MQKGNTSKIPQIQNEFICYSYHKLLLYLCYALLTHIYQQKEYDVLKQKKQKMIIQMMYLYKEFPIKRIKKNKKNQKTKYNNKYQNKSLTIYSI